VADEAIAILRDAVRTGELTLPARELPWLDSMQDEVDRLPDDEQAFIDAMIPTVDPSKLPLAEYELA